MPMRCSERNLTWVKQSVSDSYYVQLEMKHQNLSPQGSGLVTAAGLWPARSVWSSVVVRSLPLKIKVQFKSWDAEPIIQSKAVLIFYSWLRMLCTHLEDRLLESPVTAQWGALGSLFLWQSNLFVGLLFIRIFARELWKNPERRGGNTWHRHTLLFSEL